MDSFVCTLSSGFEIFSTVRNAIIVYLLCKQVSDVDFKFCRNDS